MDRFIDARFDHVEKALAALIDSIAKYNPSTALAENLLAADRALSRGLEEIQEHQNNYLRICALRAEAAARDGQIKDTLQALAAARRDMLAAPATVFPEDSPNDYVRRTTRHYDFTYDELMSYARRISRNTVPAPGQTDGAEFFGGPGGPGDGGLLDPGTVPGTAPGTVAATPATVATPGGLTNGAAGTPGLQSMDVDTPAAGATTTTPAPATAAAAAAAGASTAAGSVVAATPTTPHPFSSSIAPPTNVPQVLPPDYQQYVAPAAGTVFFPWPMPDLMQNGALRALQTATAREANRPGGGGGGGGGGATDVAPGRIRFVSLEEQEEEERRRAAREAEEREQREARQRQMEAEAQAHAAAAAAAAARPSGGSSSGGHGHGPARPAAPTQFASTLDMDDDDD